MLRHPHVRQMAATDAIVFMHVPKCAGEAFVNSLAHSLGTNSILRGFDRSLFGAFDDFDTVAEGLRNQIYLDRQPRHYSYAIIAGHKSLFSLQAAYRNQPLVTIMREPRIRLLSHYIFWRLIPDENLALWGRYGEYMKLARAPIGDFLKQRTIACQTDNIFTRFLLSPHPDIPVDGFIAERSREALIRDGLAKLACFDFVDFIENPSIEQRLSDWLGRDTKLKLHNETIPNANRAINLHLELTPEALERMQSLTAVDRQLWIYLAEKLNAFPDAASRSEQLFARYVEIQTENHLRYM